VKRRKSAAELAVLQSSTEAIIQSAARHSPKEAPQHLQPATLAWWRSVTSEYALEPHHLRLLQAACEAWDMCQAARTALALHGLTFTNSQGEPRTRPEVAIERDSRLTFARLVRELDLDTEPPADGWTRPPALKSNRR